MKLFRWFVAAATLAAIGALLWVIFPGDERRIRRELDGLAALFSVTEPESELVRVARATRFGRFLTEDAVADVGDGTTALTGRNALAALVAQTPIPPGGLRVDVVGADVTVAPDRETAEVAVRVRVTSGEGDGGRPVTEDHEIACVWHNVEGRWLVARARLGGGLPSAVR